MASAQSPEGAANAIQIYAYLLNRYPDDASIRRHMLALADFVLAEKTQQLWKNDPVTSMAHYQLAMAFHKENNLQGDWTSGIDR